MSSYHLSEFAYVQVIHCCAGATGGVPRKGKIGRKVWHAGPVAPVASLAPGYSQAP